MAIRRGSTNTLPFAFNFPSLSKTLYGGDAKHHLTSRRLVGVEFEQVSNLPEKKNIQKYIKFWAWSNNVNFDPNATCFLKCSVLVPLRRYFKIWLPVNQHYRSTTYLQERIKELYPLLANLLYMLILSTKMEIP